MRAFSRGQELNNRLVAQKLRGGYRVLLIYSAAVRQKSCLFVLHTVPSLFLGAVCSVPCLILAPVCPFSRAIESVLVRYSVLELGAAAISA